MKTKTEIRKRARAIAEMHYYADVDGRQLWEPFENYPKSWIDEEIKQMSHMLTRQMLWAQEKHN
ncbi:MAG: hypothetical protein ACK42H_19490 [Planctomycetota bacterium]|jgi:hypothetical protein